MKSTSKHNKEIKALLGPSGDEISFFADMDYAGRESQNAVFGDRVSSSRTASIMSHFYWGINALDIAVVTTGNGVAAAVGNKLRVGTTAATGTAAATSKDRIYYRTGHDAYALFTARWVAPDGSLGGDAVLCAGPYDDQSGYALVTTSLGFGVVHRKGGSDSVDYDRSTWLDPLDGSGSSGFTLDTTKINIFRITYGYLGIAPAVFEVYGGFLYGWIPFYAIDVANKQTDLIIDFPYLPIRFEASGTFTGEAYMESGSWAGGIIGDTRVHVPQQHWAWDSAKNGIGTTLTNMVSIRPAATFRGVTNHIPLSVEYIASAAQVTIGQAIVKISVWRNATLGGTPNWQSVNPESSTEYDTAGTTVTGGDFLGSFLLTEGGSNILQQEHGQVGARPGEMLTIAAQTTANTANVAASIRWQDLM